MKRVLSFACLCSFALAVSLAAQTPAPAKIVTEADYAATMKEVGQNNGVMTKSIKGDMPDEASEGGDAARNAVQECSRLLG